MCKHWLEQYQETGGGSLTLLDVCVSSGWSSIRRPEEGA